VTRISNKVLDSWAEWVREVLVAIRTLFPRGTGIASGRRRRAGLWGRHRILRAINSVATAALESSDLEELLARSLRETILAMGMHAGVVYLTDDDEGMRMVCQQGLPEKALSEATAMPSRDDIIGCVLAQKMPFAIADLSRCQHSGARRWVSYGYRSLIGARLTSGEKAAGAVVLLHKKNRPLSQVDSEILRRIASVMGLAIERAQEYEEVGDALVGIRRVSRLNWDAPTAGSFEEALESLAQAACEAALGISSMISVMDEEGRVVHRAAFGYTRQALCAAPRIDALSGRVAKTGKHLVISQPTEMRGLIGAEVVEAGFASAVCLPLAVSERTTGTLWVNYETSRRFPSWELEQLQTVAQRVSAAVEGLRQSFSLRRRVERYRALQKFSARISSCPEVNDVLQALADSARGLLEATFAMACFSDGEIAAQAISSADEASVQDRGKALPDSRMAAALRKFCGRAVRSVSSSRSPRTEPSLAVPLLDERNEPAGVLMVADRRGPGDFDGDDAELLEAMAGQVSAAIKNIKRHQLAQKSVQEYRAFLDEIAVAIATVNSEQTITSVNKKFEELTGFSKREVEGKIFLWEIVPESERRNGSVLQEGKAGDWPCPHEREAFLRTKDGSQKKVKLSVRGVENSGSIIVCLREVEEVSGVESAGATAPEMPALHRTILNVLSSLQKSLVASSYRLLELVRGASHEEARQALHVLHEDIQACSRTLEEFRVLAEYAPPEKELVNINELIEDLAGEKKEELRHDNVGVILRQDSELPAVYADPQKLRWALARLMDDSRRAMRESASVRTLTVETSRRGQTAVITVADTRPPLPAEHIEELFRLPEGGGGELPGELNVSLAACRAVIERHNWRISAESPPGGGVAFVIELPLPEREPERAEPSRKITLPESPSEERAPRTGAKNALVVDDEDVVIGFLSYYLRSQGHCVETSRNGRDAQRKLRDRDYDLIFCDVKTRGLSARELFQWLETNKPGMAGRVIFIRGDAPTPETLAFLNNPPKRWLGKPFDVTELRKLMTEVVGEATQ